MKKIKGKKLIAVTMAVVACLSSTGTMAFAQDTRAIGGTDIIVPYNIAITRMENSLDLGSGGKLNCFGKTAVSSGYKAGIKVELQQLDGSWTTIKTWNSKGNSYVEVDEDYYVRSGYQYRLKLTHTAYNSSGSLIETIPDTSDIVSY